jgi:IstB-like ATP binding protein
LVAEKKRAREHRGLNRLALAAPRNQAFLRYRVDRSDNLCSNTSRLLQLLDTAGAATLEEALVEVLARNTVHIGAFRQVIDRLRSERGLPPPVSLAIAHDGHRDIALKRTLYDLGKPIVLSTNKAFAEWSEVFPHAACVVTLFDRLIHRAEVIEIDADSYRLKAAKELIAARSKHRGNKSAS